ncbi:hypothetical protein [Streptobacillus moniliformis]|uniref:hypothetical protein n=1 Tax=Streptobacillus moniliformis TaxID=34105 RepID=UPI0007E36BC0|nr:hypothetical protein [Streptobacillus moniliformis]
MKKLLLLILLGMLSFSSNIVGPRYRLEGSIGGGYAIAKNSTDDHNLTNFDLAGATLFEYESKIDDKKSITFGPKIAVKIGGLFGGNQSVTPSINLGAEIDLNYKVKEDVKLYFGLEAGIGLGVIILLPIVNSGGTGGKFLSGIAKLSVGAKIKDKYNIGFYGGYGKGNVGIEIGRMF